MDNLATMQIGETIEHTVGNFSQHFFSGAPSKLLDFLVDTVETTAFAELHSDGNGTGRLVHERTVIAADVVRGAVFVEIELTHDLLLHIWIRVCCYNLWQVRR